MHLYPSRKLKRGVEIQNSGYGSFAELYLYTYVCSKESSCLGSACFNISNDAHSNVSRAAESWNLYKLDILYTIIYTIYTIKLTRLKTKL